MTFEVSARPEVREIAVVGDFNGWSPSAHVMMAAGAVHRVTVDLATGHRYRVKYLADGERWENDWAADDYETNEYGGDDSVVDVVSPPWTATESSSAVHDRGVRGPAVGQ